MGNSKSESDIVIVGIWSTYIPDDRIYGASVVIYNFREDGAYQITIIPISKNLLSSNVRDLVGSPTPSFVIEGKYRVKKDQLFLTEGVAGNKKEHIRGIALQENTLIVTMPEPDKQVLILMRSQNL